MFYGSLGLGLIIFSLSGGEGEYGYPFKQGRLSNANTTPPPKLKKRHPEEVVSASGFDLVTAQTRHVGAVVLCRSH